MLDREQGEEEKTGKDYFSLLPNKECLYMYNRDKTILYYSISNVKEFLKNINIHGITFDKHLKNGTYYLGKYLFTKEFEPPVKFKNMSIPEVALMLNKDREKFRRRKG